MAVHRRFVLLVSLITIALGAAACGRATEDQINQALGITPTATQSAEQVAAATEAASATAASARQLAASSPGAAVLGDVTSGKPPVPDLVQWMSRTGWRGTGHPIAGKPRRHNHGRDALATRARGRRPYDPPAPGPYLKTEISRQTGRRYRRLSARSSRRIVSASGFWSELRGLAGVTHDKRFLDGQNLCPQ